MKKMRNVARYYCGNGCNFVGYGTAKTAFYKASTPSYSAHSRNTKLGQWRSTAKEGRPCVLYSTVQNTNRDTSGDGPIRQTLSPYFIVYGDLSSMTWICVFIRRSPRGNARQVQLCSVSHRHFYCASLTDHQPWVLEYGQPTLSRHADRSRVDPK